MLDQLMNDLRYGNPQQRSLAALEIGKRHEMDAMPLLITALQDEDQRVRAAVASALAHYGSQAYPALPNLLKCLKDVSWQVRKEAVSALGTTGQVEAVKPLVRLINESHTPATEMQHLAVAEAIGALGRLGSRQGLETLIKILEKGYRNALTDWQLLVRQKAAISLGLLDQPEGNKALIGCLYHKERPELRYMLGEGLALLRSEQSFKLMLEGLSRRLEEDQEIGWWRQETLVRAFGGRGDRRAVSYILPLASVQQPEIRLALIHTLVRLGEVNHPEVLMNLLRDGIPEVRVATAYALGHLQIVAASEALAVMARDNDQRVAYAAQFALASFPVAARV